MDGVTREPIPTTYRSSAPPAQHLAALREQERGVIPVDIVISVTPGKPTAQPLPIALSQAAQEIRREVGCLYKSVRGLSLWRAGARRVIPLGNDLRK